MTPPRILRTAVFASGGGTTLQYLLAERNRGALPITVELVVVNRAGIGAVDIATAAGVEWKLIPTKGREPAESSAEAFDACRAAAIDLVLLGGYLALLKIPPDFAGRVLNIHPSLIPAFCGKGFYGRHVHEAAVAAGVKVSGCTVHFVDDAYDHGPIVLQRTVPVRDDDTPDDLAARVFAAERAAYPDAVRLYAEGRLEIVGRTVRVRPAE
ncbi:MAG: phosphoribosylglycinamide formyltransferase [Planctomycetia bacterium]